EQTVVAAPCYTLGGAPVPVARDCTRSDVANPYWNAPAQPLLDPNARYVPYTIFPGAIGTADNGFDYPYVATAILNYKRDKLAVTPSLQFQAGNRYGAPETMPGVDPSRACGILPGSTSLDPRYPYGAAGGSPFDANCGPGQLDAIPDSYTRAFDGIGAFREPAQLLLHLRLTYALSDRASLTLTLANLLQTCFGGEHTPFTYAWNGQICSYTGLNPLVTPVGNLYDPGANVQTILRYPYEPSFGVYNDIGASLNQPFGAYLGLTLRL
ncbi:MAG TPA: hypothetical protein VMH02_02865, partial [Verrucomicrobiae bacterium]|nr:hypothetical protein [Verrucomicrobiae bacterium]